MNFLSGFLNHCDSAEETLDSGDFSANTDMFIRQREDRGKPWYPSHPWNKQTWILFQKIVQPDMNPAIQSGTQNYW